MNSLSRTFFYYQRSIISVFLLISLLCAFISHAEHFDLKIDLGEAQQCQLCQNNIDTPVEFSVFDDVKTANYPAFSVQLVSAPLSKQLHKRPLLRAPPVYHAY